MFCLTANLITIFALLEYTYHMFTFIFLLVLPQRLLNCIFIPFSWRHTRFLLKDLFWKVTHRKLSQVPAQVCTSFFLCVTVSGASPWRPQPCWLSVPHACWWTVLMLRWELLCAFCLFCPSFFIYYYNFLWIHAGFFHVASLAVLLAILGGKNY